MVRLVIHRRVLTLARGPDAAPDPVTEPTSWVLSAEHRGLRKSLGRAEIDPFEVDTGRLIKAAPAGARWITVHPNGPGSQGQPLLVQESKHGSGVFHVIGGAGGKLNYLKLRNVRDPGEYHQEAAERRKIRQAHRAAERKQIAKREKESGTRGEKQRQRVAVDDERRAAEHGFIAETAKAMGWKDHVFDPAAHPNLSEAALHAAARKHHREWLKRANEAVDKHEQVLLQDADARARALGHDPLEPDAEPLDLSDIGLQPTRKAQLGASTNFHKESAKRGADTAEIQAEAEASAPEPTPGTVKRRITGEAIAEELKGFRSGAEDAPDRPPGDEPALDTNTILNLARAQKQAKVARKRAAEIKRRIDTDEETRGAYHLSVSDVGMDEVREDLLNDLRTASTRAFLGEIGTRHADPDKTLGAAMTEGAYGSINALAVTVAGAGLMDRMVVDTLGIAPSAQILARKLKSQLSTDELADLQDAMGEYHADHYLKATESALKKAREAEAAANAIDIDEAATGADLQTLKALNDRRAQAADEAGRILGRTLGEMEANAALVAALRGSDPDRLSLPIGGISREDAVTRARAIGLEPGDYRVHTVGREQYLEIGAAGMDRLTTPVKREDLDRYRESRAILTGERDELGWLPAGIADRPDLGMDGLQPGVAPKLAEPFAPGEDLPRSIRDYIGGRTADGDAPADILADLHSQALSDQSGDSAAYWKALDETVPRHGDDGKPILADAHRERFEAMADAFVHDRYGAARQPLHRQRVEANGPTIDALHRTLAEIPEGAAAYKPVGDLTLQDRRGLRQWFARNVAAKDERGRELAGELKAIEDREPPKTAPLLFGADGPNPDWHRWKTERDGKADELNASGLTWARYAQGMGGSTAAITAVQDLVRSEVSRVFAEHHNMLNRGARLKIGRQSIRGGLDHLDMIDPQARAERQRQRAKLADSLQERDRGKYASGSVSDKLSQAAEHRRAAEQSQVDMFGFAAPDTDEPPDVPLKGDQRYSLGHAAERQIAGLMQHVGRNFKPGDQVKLWHPSMNGKHVLGQRAIKYIEANKRVALGLGVGTGKTLVGLGAFTDLHNQGKAKKGLFVVPSSVQGQFHGEALRYLDPSKGYNWHAKPGASRDERLAAMRDPENHFSVVTHQSLRDDLLHLGAESAGIEPAAMAEKLAGMSVAERKAWAEKVMDEAGIKPDFVMLDEAHGSLNRKGKDNSALANVLDAVGHNAEYHVLASADPVKNDASEVHSLLQKLDPERYADRDRFLRRYGGDTPAKRDALRREMTPYLMTGHATPDVKVSRTERSVALNEGQRKAVDEIGKHLAAARMGRIKGKPDVGAIKALSPASFEGVPEAQHGKVAARLQRSLGVLRESAMRSAIDDRGKSAKLEDVSKLAAERKGKPGVIFAHSLDVARDLHDRLTKEGHRVGLLTGAQSGKERDAVRQGFQPEAGDPKHDILVMSDAGAVGINAQRGQWLVQYDVPQTAMVHAQRQGRINRIGQKNDVELIDLVADHPHEHRARERLRDKYALRETLTDPIAGLDDTGVAAYLARRQAAREAGQGGLF